MKISKARKNLLIGIFGCILFVIGDFLYAAIGKKQSTETLGLMVKVAYLDMATWRMIASIICGVVGTILYYIGFHQMYKLLKLRIRKPQDQKWLTGFRAAYLTGTVCWAYVHSMFMNTALIFKFTFDNLGLARGKQVYDFRDYTLNGKFLSGNGNLSNLNILPYYSSLIEKNINMNQRKIKVVVDPGNGTTSLFAENIYKMFNNLDVTMINNVSDPNFPNHHPDPNVAENMIQLQNKVLEIKADIGIAFDGDGDRVGVVNNLGEIVSTEYLMILAIRSLINKTDNKTFLYDVKCSKALEDEIIKLGGTPLCYRTGASYTRYKTNLEKLIFGGEYSGHLYFNERWLGFDSGIYNGLRILEILSNSDLQLSQMFDDVNKYVITPEIKIKVTDESKESIVNNMKKEYIKLGFKINDIDGIKVSYENGWVLLRASNTTPNLTIRIEADTKENQTIINNHFMSLLKKHLD